MPLLQRLFRRDNRRPTDIETVETERPVDRWLPSNLTPCKEGDRGATLCARGMIGGLAIIRVSAQNPEPDYQKEFRDRHALCYMWDKAHPREYWIEAGALSLGGVGYLQRQLDAEYEYGRIPEPALVNRMLARRPMKIDRLTVVATDFFWAKKGPSVGRQRWLYSDKPYPHV